MGYSLTRQKIDFSLDLQSAAREILEWYLIIIGVIFKLDLLEYARFSDIGEFLVFGFCLDWFGFFGVDWLDAFFYYRWNVS